MVQLKTVEKVMKEYTGENGFAGKDNANMTQCASGLYNWVLQYVMKKRVLDEIGKISPEAAKAHDNGSLHFHDLWTSEYLPYCSSFPLETILRDGLFLSKRAGPAKHLSTILDQLINFMTSAAQEVAGAIAFGDFDVLLAPLVKHDGLKFTHVKQLMQSYFYNLNQPTRYGFQSNFTNLNICQGIPKRYDDKVPNIAGEEMSFTYHDCLPEIEMINRAMFEMHVEGDYDGAPFTFPILTVELDENFDYESEMAEHMFKMTALRGQPYFLNYNVDYIDKDSILAMCCRLNINYEEVQAHVGGKWSIGESTGSIGVVSINMPRIGYMAKSLDEVHSMIDRQLAHARVQLSWKREQVLHSYDTNMIPTVRRYLPRRLATHFNTIGIVGMHDFAMNFLEKPIWDPEAVALIDSVLTYIRNRLTEFQQEDGVLWNLEQTPAERTASRFAYYDKRKFRGKSYVSINVDGREEYTNSTHLPVDIDDLVKKIEVEGHFQEFFTGGSISHLFLDEMSEPKALGKFIKKTAENSSLGYFSITPTITHCHKCKKTMVGSFTTCITCGGNTDVWSRVVGYYRNVSSWNPSKQEEFSRRKAFILK